MKRTKKLYDALAVNNQILYVLHNQLAQFPKNSITRPIRANLLTAISACEGAKHTMIDALLHIAPDERARLERMGYIEDQADDAG